MNRATVRARAWVSALVQDMDMADGLALLALCATLGAGIWILAGLGLTETGYELAGVAK